MEYFKMTPSELEKAQKILRTYETNIERYDLDYGYDEELNESPDVPEDMDDYSETLLAAARVELEKPEAERDWEQIMKDMGLAGALRKITGKIDEAEKMLKYSLALCVTHKMAATFRVQQAIRLADVKRRRGHMEEALTDLEKLLQETASVPELNKYQDVVIQHTGKTYFTMGEYQQALKNFELALKMRIRKGDEELIASTKTAIAACKNQIQ
jgi:tetratricopeptide (TPR) repeat protein